MNRPSEESAESSGADATSGRSDAEADPDLADSEVVRPGARLVATSWGEAPGAPLDILEPFVQPEMHHGQVIDWRVTSGLGAPIDPEIVDLFDEWRSRWVRSHTLESLTNLRRLHDLASDVRPSNLGTVWLDHVGRMLDDGAGGWVSLDDLRVLASDCRALGDMVRQRGEAALGAVDTTPERAGTGLAETWALPDQRQVIAADADLRVSVDPAGSLVAIRSSSRGELEQGDRSRGNEMGISRVEINSNTVEIEADDDHWSLPASRAKPLTWILPGATSWNVREIPEVIVWAKTFTELPDSCEEAMALKRPIQLSIDAPISAVSAAPRRT